MDNDHIAPNNSVSDLASASRLAGGLGLLYTAISYVLFLVTITLFSVAVSGAFIPWGESQTRPTAAALGINLVLILLFAVQHTIMARSGFKKSWTQIIPAHLERSTFVLATSIILGTIVTAWQPISGHVWEVVHPTLRMVMWGLVVAGYLGLVASSFMIDHFHLFGLKQSWAYFTGKPAQKASFREPWAYSKVRHPMMTAVLVIMWATPTMSASQLVMAILFSVYILVGIRFEERELVDELGDAYLEYAKRVPKLIPGLW